jgi:hypothetical protein
LVDTSAAPPLAAWLLAAVLALAMIGSLAWWVAAGEEPGNLFLATPDCGVPHEPRGNGPTIVAVGTSLLGYGVGPADRFQAMLQGARWHSCWVGGGRWGELAATLPRLESQRPDILLIQEGLLVGEPVLEPGLVAVVMRKIRHSLGLQEVSHRIFCGQVAPADEPVAPGYAKSLAPRHDILADATAWIARFEAAGTRVVVLDIPRSPALEATLGPILTQRRVALEAMAAAGGGRYWSFAAPTGADAYCPDGAHLAAAGRRQFELQLAARLRTAVGQARQ